MLTNYDRLTRPENQNKATRCNVALTIIHMQMDEARGVLTTHAWLKMNWTDSKMSWDNNSYDGISEIRVTADEARLNVHFTLHFIDNIINLLIRFGNLIWLSTTALSRTSSITLLKQTKFFTWTAWCCGWVVANDLILNDGKSTWQLIFLYKWNDISSGADREIRNILQSGFEILALRHTEMFYQGEAFH